MRRLPAMPTRMSPPVKRPLVKHSPPMRAKRPSYSPVSASGAARGERESEKTAAAWVPVTLRLAIGREGIGIELARPVRFECLSVTELTATLPATRFPIDVSGGVPRFRHRRGVLQRVALELNARALERWAAPRLRGLVGAGRGSPNVWVHPRAAGATVCVSAGWDADDGDRALALPPATSPIIVFDVSAMTVGDDLAFVVERARGSDLPGTAIAIAIGCVGALFGPIASRAGAVFVVQGAARALALSLMPRAGARVPSTDGVCWTSLAADQTSWVMHASRGGLPATPTEEALRARDVALLLVEADDALLAGDEARARSSCVEALGRAPTHVEIVRRIVDIDARAGGRSLAALATLAEVRDVGAGASFGTVPGEMLLAIGDAEGATASFERAAETEPAAPLAARAFELAAGATKDAEMAAQFLDRALVRAPRAISPRWKRVLRRLELGRLEDALADVEHLDAMARGGDVKAAIWLQAGRAWQERGHTKDAGALFERALRYAPDEAAALSGLGMALLSGGHAARGLAVLGRALELTNASEVPCEAIRLELARALAEHLDDLPIAIAHVSTISAEAPEAAEARGLEGRWRERLGDRAGALLSFARVRELASTLAPASNERGAATTAAFLAEAAQLERRSGDVMSAQRHLSVALRLRPHDVELRRAYREVGALIAGKGTPELATPIELTISPSRSTSADDLSRTDDAEDESRATARVQELMMKLQGDPRDEAVGDELASLLESLGRGHELLALLSARVEEGAPERRTELVRAARAAMTRVAAVAARSGRDDEASFYRDAMGLLVE